MDNNVNTAMLVVCIHGKEPQVFPLDKDKISLGSTQWSNTSDIEIASPLLSDKQGQFLRWDNGYQYEDLTAAKDTWHNGQLLGSHDVHGSTITTLREGDVLRIDQPQDGQSHEQAVVMIYHSHFDAKITWRSMNLSQGKVKLYISRNEEITSERAEVSEESVELPRHYATLTKEENTWYVEDHNTRFGVSVNHQSIEKRTALHALDVITIGNTLFLYQQDTLYYNHKDSLGNSLMIHIEERSVWNLFRRQVLLEDINMTIRPGEMVLILGGSGAGKTTFVNAVMGYEKAKGTILEGDIDIYKNYNQMKYAIGFVPQQDLLRMEDNVYETLENAAELKMPKSTSPEERKQRIKDVLGMFGLEREKASLVQKLSGGQRKRLSIAVEFIADPTLFFLDEPDSGLDGVMARSLMEDLRKIANQDKIVLVITHSPDRVADLFHKVIVLAKGNEDNIGHLAFYGNIEEALTFFETDSLENIVRKINRADEGGEGLADQYIQKYKEIEGMTDE